jgi:hypothetical protein
MTPCGLYNPGITETLIATTIQVSTIFVVLQYTGKTGILFAIALWVVPEDCVYDRNPVVESLHMSIHTVGQELIRRRTAA